MSEASKRLATYLMLGASLSPKCEECGGTGWTVQGWTDKNGFSEDQYGPCAACVSRT